MITFILLSLFQALLLPGLVFAKVKLGNLPFLDRALLATPLSLLLNFVLVSILYGFSIYSKELMLVIIFMEVLALIFLVRRSSAKIIMLRFCFDSLEKNIIYLLLLFAYVGYFVYIYKSNFMSVFTDWDAVVSWNRWAQELNDHDYNGSAGYPLGIPVLLSIVYKLTGTANVESFSKLIYAYWFFISGLFLLRAGMLAANHRFQLGLASVVLLYLSSAALGDSFLFGGYVDSTMISYGSLLLYLYSFLFLSRDGLASNKGKNFIFVLALALASASLVKMTGVIVTGLFLVTIYIHFKKKGEHFPLNFYELGTIAIVSVGWYIFSFVFWRDYQSLYSYSAIQDSRYFIRPLIGIKRLYDAWGLILLFLFSYGVFYTKVARGLTLWFLLPLFLFWSILVGYDIRAASIFFPIVSFAISIAIFKLPLIMGFLGSTIFLGYKELIANRGKRAFFLILALICLLIGISQVATDEKIIQSNTDKKVHANDFGANKILMNIFMNEPKSKIISCWQMPYGLPGAKGKFIPTGCHGGMSEVDKWLSDDSIKYLLYWRSYDESKYPTVVQVAEYLSAKGIRFSTVNLASGYFLFSKN